MFGRNNNENGVFTLFTARVETRNGLALKFIAQRRRVPPMRDPYFRFRPPTELGAVSEGSPAASCTGCYGLGTTFSSGARNPATLLSLHAV